MADKSPLAYLPETSEEAIEANRNYQEALQRLNASLDQRKNRFFDPRYMAAAQAFLSPTKTGSFFEALGTAAGAVGQAQEGLLREDQEIAKLKLDVAGQQLGMERQRQLMAPYMRHAKQGLAPQPGQESSPGALPGAPPARSGAIDIGITEDEFMNQAAQRGIPYSQARVEWLDVQNKAADFATKGFKTTEGGAYRFNPQTGQWEFSAVKTGKPTSAVIFGPGGGQSYDNIPQWIVDAMAGLDASDPEYIKLANMALTGTAGSPPAKPSSAQDEGPTPPLSGAPPSDAPSRLEPSTSASAVPVKRRESMSEAEARRAREATELKIYEEGEKTAASEQAKAIVEEEKAILQSSKDAYDMRGSSKQVLSRLNKSPNYFGIFARPGLIPAIGNLINKGIKTPAGTIELAGWEDTVRQLMPKATQKDIDNVANAAAELAAIELNFTKIFLRGQGQVTEGERRIVQRVSGTVSNSVGMLKTRMELLKERAQYDIDIADAFQQFKKNNPRKNIRDFQNSELAKTIRMQYDRRLDRIYENMSGSKSKGSEPKPSAEGSPSERLDKILGGR